MRLAVQAGIRDFGENRIQDALDKFDIEPFPEITRHFIGYLQSNKINKCLQNFQWLHSLQKEKLVRKIDSSENPLYCLIEVNISGEESKSGLNPEQLRDFVQCIRKYRRIRIRGLMGMAAYTNDREAIRHSFMLLRELLEDCRALETDNVRFEELSMGMSHDYRIALEAGATMLRIGTAIFGPRED
jgi:PLP dependent protein